MKYKVFSSLRHRNFRYFYVGQCISLMGTWMQRTAQVWLVYSMTKSPLLLSLLGVCQFGPMLLLSLFAGVFVDRFPKRKILIFTQSVFMIQALVLALLVLTGYVKYWEILALATIFGLIQTLDMPARQSFFVEMVGKEDLMNAISLNSTIVNLGKIVGPMFAGIVMAETGAGFCFLLNGVSYIAVIYGLFLIDIDGVSHKKVRDSALKEIKDGIAYILNSKILKLTFVLMAIVCTFAMNIDIIIPVFTKDILHMGVEEYTMLLSAMGIGALIGAVVMAGRSRKGLNKSVLLWDGILVSIMQMTLIYVRNYYMVFLIIVIAGFLNLTFLNMANSFLQLNSADDYRGRVMSVYALVNMGSTPIGNFYAGAAMEKMGGQMGFFMCGAITFILIMIVLLFRSKKRLA